MKTMLEMYEAALEKHGDSSNAVLWAGGRQKLRYHALTRHILRSEDFSLLDFGCGLAHLKPFLDEHFTNVQYVGAEALPKFVKICRKKYPTSEFFEEDNPKYIDGSFDYVVSSGAFNILYVPDQKHHRDIVFEMMRHLLEKARVYLSVNFMTDSVDFRQPHAYHQNVVELYTFACKELSRRLVVDQQYMPYEFTLTIWKDQQIQRPENIYGNNHAIS